MSARLLQLTNTSIGPVAADSNVPLGITTVVFPGCCNPGCPTYSVASSNSDTLVVNKSGTYSFIYNASLVAAAAGDLVLALKVNGVTKYTVTAVAVAGGALNITIPFEIFIPCNCLSNPANVPASIQIQNTGVAITSGTSNLIISKE
jgi:hypothetical protein